MLLLIQLIRRFNLIRKDVSAGSMEITKKIADV